MESSTASAPRVAEQLTFVTDPEICRRLELAENGIVHAEYQLGVVKRELIELRAELAPRAA